MDVRSAWFGERLAVFADAKGVDGNDDEPRGDWYLLDGPTPRNLTAAFPGKSPELIGLGEDSLLLLHNGDLWRVDAAGERKNLTASIDEEVKEWRQPSPYGGLPHYNLQPVATAVVQIASEGKEASDRLLFIDVASGRIDTVTAGSSKSEFVAASPAARRAAFIDKSGNETLLMVADADGSRRELVRLNRHLKGVVGGTPVRIDHEGPKGDDHISWLLLPPDYKPGTRLATIRSEEHTSELQSLMRISYAVFCLKKKTITQAKIEAST